MHIDDFAGACTQTTLVTPVSMTANGNTAGVNMNAYSGKCMVTLSSLNTAGTNPTLALKLQHAQEADLIGTVSYSGTGNGTISQLEAGADSVAENIVITFTNATSAGVVGGTSGSLGTATVGTVFTSGKISFLLTAGGTAFVNTDAFTVATTERVYADVSGGAFTGLTSGAGHQKLQVNADQLGKFWRVNRTIGGTVSPGYTCGIAVHGMANQA
jgi:hypothetical protein